MENCVALCGGLVPYAIFIFPTPVSSILNFTMPQRGDDKAWNKNQLLSIPAYTFLCYQTKSDLTNIRWKSLVPLNATSDEEVPRALIALHAPFHCTIGSDRTLVCLFRTFHPIALISLHRSKTWRSSCFCPARRLALHNRLSRLWTQAHRSSW